MKQLMQFLMYFNASALFMRKLKENDIQHLHSMESTWSEHAMYKLHAKIALNSHTYAWSNDILI